MLKFSSQPLWPFYNISLENHGGSQAATAKTLKLEPAKNPRYLCSQLTISVLFWLFPLMPLSHMNKSTPPNLSDLHTVFLHTVSNLFIIHSQRPRSSHSSIRINVRTCSTWQRHVIQHWAGGWRCGCRDNTKSQASAVLFSPLLHMTGSN